ncbi:MAG: hypothetical protein Q7Q71_13610 [Verrucomicrobiota bacterium JB023]|nr:hypothetical protein [Verrucomicrobiota bacterium JB023]
MKLKFVSIVMAASGLLIAPLLADVRDEKVDSAAQADDMVAAYVVTASGGG